jgi:sigma-B regulation protein RsbU (phosphoserine phosphatase)
MPALVARGDKVEEITATGLPVGMFCQAKFSVSRISLAPGDVLLLYTDGYTESRDPEDEEFGRERLAALLARHAQLPPRDLLAALMKELGRFRSGTPMNDDLSLMVLQRAP